jgi:hypothetical protein
MISSKTVDASFGVGSTVFDNEVEKWREAGMLPCEVISTDLERGPHGPMGVIRG